MSEIRRHIVYLSEVTIAQTCDSVWSVNPGRKSGIYFISSAPEYNKVVPSVTALAQHWDVAPHVLPTKKVGKHEIAKSVRSVTSLKVMETTMVLEKKR